MLFHPPVCLAVTWLGRNWIFLHVCLLFVCLFPSRIQIQLEGKDFRKLNETPGNKNLRIARCAQNPKQEGFTEAVKRRYIHETEFTLWPQTSLESETNGDKHKRCSAVQCSRVVRLFSGESIVFVFVFRPPYSYLGLYLQRHINVRWHLVSDYATNYADGYSYSYSIWLCQKNSFQFSTEYPFR